MAQARNTGIFQGLQGDCSYVIDLIKHDITVGLLNITILNLIPAISLSVTIGLSFVMHFDIPWSIGYFCILVCFSLFVMEGYAHLDMYFLLFLTIFSIIIENSNYTGKRTNYQKYNSITETNIPMSYILKSDIIRHITCIRDGEVKTCASWNYKSTYPNVEKQTSKPI